MDTQQTFLETLVERVDDIIADVEQSKQLDDSTELILEAAQNLRDEIAAQID